MNRRKSIILGITALSFAGALGYGIRALASGIPTANALVYAGVLEDATGPLNGSHNIQVIFYGAASAGTNLCQSTTSAISVSNGHFSVQLPDTCTAAVGANANVWVDVLVDGSDTGRTKIGAVPYAVEANHATNADNVTGPGAQQLVPQHGVMFFNLAACPAGWSDLTAAQGRYLVGSSAPATLGAAVGTALTDQENRAVGLHSHPITDPGHAHSPKTAVSFLTGGGTGNAQLALGGGFNFDTATAPATTGITATNNTGAVAGTNAPYLQLRVCQKN